jgi:hypothetical protein
MHLDYPILCWLGLCNVKDLRVESGAVTQSCRLPLGDSLKCVSCISLIFCMFLEKKMKSSALIRNQF